MAHYDTTIDKMKDIMRKHEGQFLVRVSTELFESDLLKDSVYEGKDKSAETVLNYLCSISDVPAKSPKATKATPVKKQHEWIDPKSLYDKAIEGRDREEFYCLYMPAKGVNKNKACGLKAEKTERDKEKITAFIENGFKPEIDIFVPRCSMGCCKKEFNEKDLTKLQTRYNNLLTGVEVRGSPNRDYNVPENDYPDSGGKFDAAEHTGINEDVTSPTSGPSDFVKGKNEGLPSPSKAKPTKKASPKFPSHLKKINEIDEHKDCYLKLPIDGYKWFVRVNKNDKSYIVGGKFEEEIEISTENYLKNLVELTEEEQERASKEMKTEYQFFGTPDDPEESGDDADDADDPEESGDDELEELINGIGAN